MWHHCAVKEIEKYFQRVMNKTMIAKESEKDLFRTSQSTDIIEGNSENSVKIGYIDYSGTS